MRYIILMVITTQILFGQNITNLHVNLSGSTNLSEKKIFLESAGYGIIDSAFSFSQHFDLSINPKNDLCYRFVLGNSKTDFFFIENEDNYIINIDIENQLWYDKNRLESNITGGVYNEVFKKNKNILEELALLKLKATTKEEEKIRDDSIYTYFSEIIQEYPFLGTILLYDFREGLREVNPKAENIKKYIYLIESLDKNFKKHPFAKEVKNTLDSLIRLTSGGLIYDFSLKNIHKEYVNTFDKRGQFLLIFFSDSRCTYVKETTEDLRKNYEDLKKLNFDILEVKLEFSDFVDDFQLIRSLDESYIYPWKRVYLFNNKSGKKILRDYNVSGAPLSFLYSRDGILLEVNPNAQKIVESLLVLQESNKQ